MHAEIDSCGIDVGVQEAGPSGDEVATVRTLLQRAYETQQHENSYWHEQIMGGYQSRSYQTVRSPSSLTCSPLCKDIACNLGHA
jgi:hypothetical protein